MSKLTCFISKFLNTDDINRFAKKNKVIAPYYLGCYPANVKPDNVNQHCCWVWNVDERDKPGTLNSCLKIIRSRSCCNQLVFYTVQLPTIIPTVN